MTRLIEHLESFGNRPAVFTEHGVVSYTQLAERVSATTTALVGPRRLVLMRTRNELDTLASYLGVLAGGHVALPVPPDRDLRAIVDTFDPDTEIGRDGAVTALSAPAGDRLHPELALLMSTSGSTGSPKLVRLSHANLVANAAAIARYLDITENDRAATTLPMSYCYGLSVVHSHLLRGAALILTDHSVVDDDFWHLFGTHAATSLAGVPYTFELLDRIGFDRMHLPHLRYLTQAGGRLPPERVRHFAELGRRGGWDFVVMYGATEATARMAYLPAHLAHDHPTSIGRPIPGGRFDIEPLDGFSDPGVGELVYRGPNVMLGYAQCRRDLALGRTVNELRTGDIARRCPDGLYEVIGRTQRFVKLYGLRVDLQRVEAMLDEQNIRSVCTDEREHLVVAVTDGYDMALVRRAAAQAAGVPADTVDVVTFRELPILPSGKTDYAAVRAAARQASAVEPSPATDVRALFAEVLHVDPLEITSESTFLDLGGTSLNYVALSVRLERRLGRLPPDWQQLPVGVLERRSVAQPSRRWSSTTLETSVLLRAVAIVLVVGSHADLFELWGGAHILLGIAGYNFGRFCLTGVPRAERIRRLRSTIAWIAVPSIAWIAVAMIITSDYEPSNLLLANKILGPHDSMTAGRLWFIEVLVYTLIGLALVCAVPLVDRLERRVPFTFAAAFLAAGVAFRYDLLGFDLGRQAWFTYLAFWFFAAGWAAAKAHHAWQRIAVTVVLAVCLVDYFDDALRGLMVLTGLLLLIWLPTVRCPAPLALLAGVLAEASLYTYLTHFQVYPLFPGHPVVGVGAALVTGVLVTYLINAVRRRRLQAPRASAVISGRESARFSAQE